MRMHHAAVVCSSETNADRFYQEKGPSFEHLCLEVEKREDFLAQCQSSGVEVKRIPKGDSLLAFIEDYDGNLFEVKE
jgi:catechol 2,3-dioxygenase-like lactoylglutathione lyase family enzyme